MKKKTYHDYINEIDGLCEYYKLGAYQKFMLQIAAAFEFDKFNYNKLKKEFTE